MTPNEIRACSIKQLQMLSIHAADAKTRQAAAAELQDRRKRN